MMRKLDEHSEFKDKQNSKLLIYRHIEQLELKWEISKEKTSPF